MFRGEDYEPSGNIDVVRLNMDAFLLLNEKTNIFPRIHRLARNGRAFRMKIVVLNEVSCDVLGSWVLGRGDYERAGVQGCRLENQIQEGFGCVQTVFSLVPDCGAGTVEHVSSDFLPTMGGKAVHENCVWLGEREK